MLWNIFQRNHRRRNRRRSSAAAIPAIECLESRRLLTSFGFDFAFELDSGNSAVSGSVGLDSSAFDAGDPADPSDDTYYVAGNLIGTVDFDPDPSNEFLLTAGSEDRVGFVAAYSPDGDFRSAWTLPASQNYVDFNVGDDGNLYVIAGAQNEFGGHDLLVSKFLPNGDHVWTEAFGRTASPGPSAQNISVDQQGNVYVTGYFGADVIDFDPDDPTRGELTRTEDWRNDFALKLDSEGGFQWVHSFGFEDVFEGGGGYYQQATGDGVYVSGSLSKNVGPYVAKLDPVDGSVDWLRTLYNQEMSLHGLTVDSMGNVWSTGALINRADFDPNPDNTYFVDKESISGPGPDWQGFVWKLDKDGEFVWADSLRGDLSNGFSITTGPDDTIYVGGHFEKRTDFDPGADEDIHDAKGTQSGFVLALNNDGSYRWAADFADRDRSWVSHVVVDDSGNVYANGGFDGTIDVDPTEGTFELTSGNFVVKLTQPDLAPPAPGFTVMPISQLETSESGGTASFTVVLNTKPLTDVIINIVSLDPTEGTVSVTQLVFTPENWDTPQEVIITGVDDGETDGDQEFLIELTATSDDPDFNTLEPEQLTVINKDNEKGKGGGGGGRK